MEEGGSLKSERGEKDIQEGMNNVPSTRME
jgi:hypothetical protein